MSASSRESDARRPAETPDGGHVPVLRDAIVSLLAPVIQRVWVDGTIGRAGHAAALFAAAGGDARLIGLDVDPDNIRHSAGVLTAQSGRTRLIQANFAKLDEVLSEAGVLSGGKEGTVDAILADLGVSTNQIFDPSRGLSFDRDGPLDMRLDPTLTTTAADLVNGLGESELADLLYIEAQEHLSRKISKRICQARRNARLATTGHLARVVEQAVGGRRGRLHPATRTFMALRRAVNEEGANLAALLRAAPRWLRPGGRLAIISFHSGEDRCVKEDFRQRASAGIYHLLTRRPLTADDAEARNNPASRSAKLRVAERTERALPDGESRV